MENQAALVPPSQNPFLQTINEFTSVFGALGQTGLSLYQNFMTSKELAKIQALQSAGYEVQPTQSNMNPFNFTSGNWMTSALVIAAVAGTGLLLWKAVK